MSHIRVRRPTLLSEARRARYAGPHRAARASTDTTMRADQAARRPDAACRAAARAAEREHMKAWVDEHADIVREAITRAGPAMTAYKVDEEIVKAAFLADASVGAHVSHATGMRAALAAAGELIVAAEQERIAQAIEAMPISGALVKHDGAKVRANAAKTARNGSR